MSSRTALRAAALAAAALALTACNDLGGTAAPAGPPAPAASLRATGAAPGSSAPAADHGLDTPPEGQARVAGLALSAWEWGNDFKQYGKDDTELAAPSMDTSCHLKGSGPVDGLTGRMQRTVTLAGSAADSVAVFGQSSAKVYRSASAAHASVTGYRADNKRCPSHTDDTTGDAFSAVHEVKAPAVTGAEEVYAEEGTAVFALDGGKKTAPLPYVYRAARKGTVVFTVFVDVEQGQSPAVARKYADEALRTLAIKW
ncbi:hypothetical protein [Kitasatospora sp. NPDC059571]|uniref:hypothetical protein n=1 Tax=Kitasatospora sp. NPDC059571 TaxID=3346871 RepID=UPI0036C58BAC